jgi:hypothetical protein
LKNALAYYNAGVVVVNSQVIGLAPDNNGEPLWLSGRGMRKIHKKSKDFGFTHEPARAIFF